MCVCVLGGGDCGSTEGVPSFSTFFFKASACHTHEDTEVDASMCTSPFIPLRLMPACVPVPSSPPLTTISPTLPPSLPLPPSLLPSPSAHHNHAPRPHLPPLQLPYTLPAASLSM